MPQVRGDEAPHEVDTSQPNDVEEFGDGFLLAGTVLLHLLRQRLRFEAADFTSHLLRCARCVSVALAALCVCGPDAVL